MVFDEGVPSVLLLKFWKQSGGDVSGTLERAQERLHRFLPCFEVFASRGGKDLLGWTESFVGVDFGDDVKGFGHDLGRAEFWSG